MNVAVSGHYGAGSIDLAKDEEWSKFVSPVLWYFTNKKGADAFAAARAQYKTEVAQWPYAWINNPYFPLKAGRGRVSGRYSVRPLVKGDPFPDCRPSTIVLTAPVATAGPWENQGKGYFAYTSGIAANCDFSINDVRPGTYELHAFTNGVEGEYTHPTLITVTAGQTTGLGILR
jgi:rhamnogalacturonan endolyase